MIEKCLKVENLNFDIINEIKKLPVNFQKEWFYFYNLGKTFTKITKTDTYWYAHTYKVKCGSKGIFLICKNWIGFDKNKKYVKGSYKEFTERFSYILEESCPVYRKFDMFFSWCPNLFKKAILNNYTEEDIYNYLGSYVYRLKKFPQRTEVLRTILGHDRSWDITNNSVLISLTTDKLIEFASLLPTMDNSTLNLILANCSECYSLGIKYEGDFTDYELETELFNRDYVKTLPDYLLTTKCVPFDIIHLKNVGLVKKCYRILNNSSGINDIFYTNHFISFFDTFSQNIYSFTEEEVKSKKMYRHKFTIYSKTEDPFSCNLKRIKYIENYLNFSFEKTNNI